MARAIQPQPESVFRSLSEEGLPPEKRCKTEVQDVENEVNQEFYNFQQVKESRMDMVPTGWSAGYKLTCTELRSIDVSITEIEALDEDKCQACSYGGSKIVHMYKGFKVGLKHLLYTIKREINEPKHHMILIHGVPMVGKSTLAQALSYFLAREGGSAKRIVFKHDHEDSIQKTESVEDTESRWIILDQCNTYQLDMARLLQYAETRSRLNPNAQTPLIMFTSGHYLPAEKWMNKTNIDFKVITMQVDGEALNVMKASKVGEVRKVANDVLLSVSTVYGHVVNCIAECREAETEITRQYLADQLYKEVDFRMLGSNYEFVTLAWPDFQNASVDYIETSEAKDWKLQPCWAQYASVAANRRVDLYDTGNNAMLNWLDARGICKCGESHDTRTGFCELDPHSFYFVFPCVTELHNLLKNAKRVFTKEKGYQDFLKTYRRLSDSQELQQSHMEGCRGTLFESLIGLHCELYNELHPSNDPPKLRGLRVMSGSCCTVPVTEQRVVESTEKLCDVVEESQKPRNIWFSLNKDQCRPFKGYNFAYLEYGRGCVTELQVIQATVNPRGKQRVDRRKMLESLKEIQHNLSRRKLIESEGVVEPYVICPSDTASQPLAIVLKTDEVVAKVIKFDNFLDMP